MIGSSGTLCLSVTIRKQRRAHALYGRRICPLVVWCRHQLRQLSLVESGPVAHRSDQCGRGHRTHSRGASTGGIGPTPAKCPSPSPAFHLDRVFIRAVIWPRAGVQARRLRMPFMLPSMKRLAVSSGHGFPRCVFAVVGCWCGMPASRGSIILLQGKGDEP